MAVWVGLGILALSAVIFAVSAVSAPRNATPELPLARTGESKRLYDEALSALRSGDTTLATSLLDRAVAADPDNSAARKKRDEIALKRSSGRTNEDGSGSALDPTGGNGGGSGDGDAGGSSREPTTSAKPSEDPGFGRPVANMGKLLPAGVSGFVPSTPVKTDTDAEIALDPAPGPNAARVTRVLLSVHDRGSKDAAAKFAQRLMDVVYSKSHTGVKVSATAASGTFGSDGGRLAALVFTRGRFAYEVVLTSNGPDPVTLRDLAVLSADSFPTKP
jgi:hypothetical protein